MKKVQLLKTEINPAVARKLLRQQFGCSYCPPNKGENQNRHRLYGSKSWKYRTKKKTQYLKGRVKVMVLSRERALLRHMTSMI